MNIIERNKLFSMSAVTLAALMSAPFSSAFAHSIGKTGKAGSDHGKVQVARGADVGALAGNCRIGPFEQTSKAGPYNELCEIMPDGEKCLAYIKQNIRPNGEIVEARNLEKALYCLEVFETELSGE